MRATDITTAAAYRASAPEDAPRRAEAAAAVVASDEPSFFELATISKSFGTSQIVKSLSLAVQKGEFVSLLGPSGCGKTTTLRMIAGFVDPDEGAITLDGARIENAPSHRRDAAMVFQNYALFPHMTVAENVGFGLRMRKIAKPEIATRVAEALELVRLGGLGARYPRELSGGQQQRVALARAVVLKPKLLLLDEPLSNLDAKLRKELRHEFLKIHRVAGTTTIFVTHDIEEAFAMSDRVAVMNRGRIEQYDVPSKIYTSPATRFVAEFVGHSNIVSGVVESSEAGPVVRAEGGAPAVRVAEGLPTGSDVHLVLPTHLVNVTRAPVDADNCLAARVNVASYLGSTVHYELRAGPLTLHATMPTSNEQDVLRHGDEAHASWQATDFIRVTGESK